MMRMKKLFCMSFVLAGMLASAQEIDVKETTENYSTGKHDALSVVVYQRGKSDVESAWKSFLKNLKAEKVNAGKKEMFADNVIIADIGNNPVDVYTVFAEDKDKNQVTLTAAYDLGGAYLNGRDHSAQQKAVVKLMHDFAYNESKAGMQSLQKDAEKVLSGLQSDQKSLEKENAGLKKDIEDYNDKITKAEKDIQATDAELVVKKGEVEAQQKVVDASSNAVSEQAKSSKKIHDKLKGQQNDLEKKKARLRDDITNYNKKIADAKNNISKNESNQDKKKDEISKQEKVVDGIKSKISGLK